MEAAAKGTATPSASALGGRATGWLRTARRALTGDLREGVHARDIQSYFRTTDAWHDDIGLRVRDLYGSAGLGGGR